MADGKAIFEYVWPNVKEDPSHRYMEPVLESAVRSAAKEQSMDKGVCVFDARCGKVSSQKHVG